MFQIVLSTFLSVLILTVKSSANENVTNSTSNMLTDVPIVEYPTTGKVSFELYDGKIQLKINQQVEF
jgi:hypothetical protein